MSETESIVEEEYIIDPTYVVLAEGEDLNDTSQIIVLEGDDQQIAEENDGNDGAMFVEEVHDIVDEGELVYQQEVSEQAISISSQQPLVLSWSELEKKRKRLNVPRVPKKFLLYDGICAEIVDYDEEDGAPIVEFSVVEDDKEAERLPVECGICPDIMHKSKLEAHLKSHLKPGTKRYKCIYCEDDFVTRSYAAGHSRRHQGIRPYICVPCTLYYCTKQDLKVHEQRRHLEKEHICEHCGKTFAQNTSLRHHRMLVHEQQRNYECIHCGKKFLRKYAMNEHIRNVHFGDRRLLDCPFCDMRFKDTHKLAQHRKEMHLNQSKFECRLCGLEFSHIDFFDAHRRSLQCRKKLGRSLFQQRLHQDDQQQSQNDSQHLPSDHHFQYDDESQQMYQQDDPITRFKQEQLEQQEVVVEEMTHDMHTEIVNEEELEELEQNGTIQEDEHEKVKAEQQLLYEIAAMDNA
ncbi:uncharacterized protein LOC142228458 [Haematobia irritans]|uniref:uncharacterized protein LOC142228458 n=1 Tax=Haematobia irritans TaxID=7368 RepID=UPI003F501E90